MPKFVIFSNGNSGGAGNPYQGPWAEGTEYVVSDEVGYDGDIYVADADNLSTALNAPGTEGGASVWTKKIDALPSGMPEGSTLVANASGKFEAGIDKNMKVNTLEAAGQAAAANMLAGALGATSEDENQSTDVLPESTATTDLTAYSGEGSSVGHTATEFFSIKGVTRAAFSHDAITAISAAALNADNFIVAKTTLEDGTITAFSLTTTSDPPISIDLVEGGFQITEGTLGEGVYKSLMLGPNDVTMSKISDSSTYAFGINYEGFSIIRVAGEEYYLISVDLNEGIGVYNPDGSGNGSFIKNDRLISGSAAGQERIEILKNSLDFYDDQNQLLSSIGVSDSGKLDGIESGAQVNVNADWNATSGDAEILNKPAAFQPSAHTHDENDINLTDLTTNDVSTNMHGFAPKLPNDEIKFLNGVGAWAVPATGSSDIKTFNAAILLDFAADPASGVIPNIGEADDDGFYVSSGSFTRVASGDSYYYQAAEDGSSLQYRAPHYTGSSGASFTSINLTDGAASVVLTDTSRDLEVLYESLITTGTRHRRAYKIQLKCNTNQFVTGFIGGITKSGNEYTMDIYSYGWISTRNWNKYNVGTWDSGSTTWEIVPEYFTCTSNFLNRWGMSFWYKGATSPASAVTPILGMYDTLGTNDLFKGHYVGAAAITTDLYTYSGNNAGSLSCGGAIVVPGRWTHYFISHGLYNSAIHVYVNGKLFQAPAGAIGYTTPPAYGLLTLGGLAVQLGTQAPKSGTCYAFVRYWANAPSEEIAYPMFEYERGLLGFGRNVYAY